MKLDKDIADKFGALISTAYMLATEYYDPTVSKKDFEAMSLEYFNIIMEIKRGIPYDHSHLSDTMIDSYMKAIAAELSVYDNGNTQIPEALMYISREIRNVANLDERMYCVETLKSFVKKLSKTFNKPDLMNPFYVPLLII